MNTFFILGTGDTVETQVKEISVPVEVTFTCSLFLTQIFILEFYGHTSIMLSGNSQGDPVLIPRYLLTGEWTYHKLKEYTVRLKFCWTSCS